MPPTGPWKWTSADSLASRYRISGLVGIGGMGVVYRAEDTRLGRTVALKFLPPALTPNPRAKVRFLDEARAASALDHPNICTIYEVGETAEGQLYLAMTCYDGETLKRRLERGPLEAVEALHIVVQVARGLAKAHRHGIVHRDIKPANLMITADGVVKILDFGIAKLPEHAPSAPLLGTPAYMSPEQARGEEVDARSDVWSLGAVLYETLAGRPPERDGHGEPREEPEVSLRAVPPQLGGVLSRMLTREPADRYPDASALLTDLSALERAAAGTEGIRVPFLSRPRFAALAAVLVAALAVTAGWILRGNGRHAEVGPATVVTSLTHLTDLPGGEWFPSLSREGDLFLYVKKVGNRNRLFLQRVGGDRNLLPDSTQDDTQPAFSPDGKQIAFRSERDGGGIFVMGATGESVRRATDFGFNPAWSPDSKEIVYATEGIIDPQIRRHQSQIFRVSLATGERRLIIRDDAVQPSWSPHDLRIAYWGISLSGQRVIWTVATRGGGAPVRVTNDSSVDWNPVWSPDGRYLYFASDRSGVINLWRVPIEERSGRVLGEPEPITTSSQASMLPSISQDGRHIAYASGSSKTILEKIDFDPASGTIRGPAVAITQTSQMIQTIDTSRDGRWLVFQTSVPQEDLFLVHPDGTGLRQLTHDEFKNRQPRWSPDGTRIAFYSTRGGKYDIWTVHADGSQLEKATAIRGRPAYHPVWSPDGKRIACDIEKNEVLVDLTQPTAERRPLHLPPAGRGMGFSASSWSADGKWLAGALRQPDGPQVPGIVLYSLARGYITIDAMNNCTTLTQPNPGYFTGGGFGNASNRNALWGDYFYQNSALNQAEGHPLVHIKADATNPSTSVSGQYTFYGKNVNWTAVDDRVPLATNFLVRYFTQYPFSSSLVVWRDSKVNQGAFACGTLPSWYPLGQTTILAFDEDSHSVALATNAFPAMAQRVPVGGGALATPYGFGWFFLDLNTTVAAAGSVPPVDPRADQAWVTVSLANGLAVGVDAIRLDNACSARHSGPL